ncbi:capsid cement protein [Vandammella animalimorsus]|uniref:DUF2190 domain-containing protein n=1 Tax=Vandammella animalimorsus TaxID=2029117 RepID=A0A2A2A6H3_9BURK|nr:capsid cement protein [Vandammella animalimorsus]PAT32870.1 DUF2190 domain-containing protein [Vandammella animalimorsus]
MKATFHPILTLSITAAVDLEHVYRFVGFDGRPAAEGAKALGVNNAAFRAGTQASVGALGVVLVEAGGAIALGAEVQCDGEGRAVTLSGGKSNGWAMDAASDAGQIIRIARGI